MLPEPLGLWAYGPGQG